MPDNSFYGRRAERLSRAELEAIETLKDNGWTSIADVYVTDGIPENGDGSRTFKFEGRQPVAVFKDKKAFANTVDEPVLAFEEPETEDDQAPKKRGRPRKR